MFGYVQISRIRVTIIVAMTKRTRFYAPALGVTFWNTAIRPSVCQSVCLSHGAAAYAIGTLAACSLATAGYQTCADCGLRTRPRTDVDPPRFFEIELPSAGGMSSRHPGAIHCLSHGDVIRWSPFLRCYRCGTDRQTDGQQTVR